MRRRQPWEPNPATMFEDVLAAIDDGQGWRFTRKGDQRLLCDIDAQKQSRRRNTAAKQAAVTARAMARRREEWQRRQPAAGESIVKQMLGVMEPGKWYSVGDIQRGLGLERPARSKMRQVMARRGLVERAGNPAYDRAKAIFHVDRAPRWLWRLTRKGEEARRRLHSLGLNRQLAALY